jgi:hypothetical protein
VEPYTPYPEASVPVWKTALVSDEDTGSQGFLPDPWTIHFATQANERSRELVRKGNAESNTGRRVAHAFNVVAGNGISGVSLHREVVDEGSYWSGVMAGLKGVVGVDVECISRIPIFSKAWRSGTCPYFVLVSIVVCSPISANC